MYVVGGVDDGDADGDVGDGNTGDKEVDLLVQMNQIQYIPVNLNIVNSIQKYLFYDYLQVVVVEPLHPNSIGNGKIKKIKIYV